MVFDGKDLQYIALMFQTNNIESQIKKLRKVYDLSGFAPQIKKIHPQENTYGYRWTMNKANKMFIITILIEGEYWHDPDVTNTLDYITDCCSILQIENIETGEKANDIGETEAYFHSPCACRIGEKIKEKTWFCLSKEHLFFSQGQIINRRMSKEFIPLG